MPPLHPNCQCSVVALDNASSLVYDLNRPGFMSAVEVMLENSDGGIWTMSNSDTNSNMRVGYVPFELRPIAVSEEIMITDDTGQFPVKDSVINWARDFGEDAAEFLQQFWDSDWHRADHRYDDFLSFWDWVSSGIISGIWNSAEARAELMLSDPTLYNIINWLMMGLPDLIGRVFDPDKPLSFEHCLANLELVTILFGVYSVYQRHASAMLDPTLDDPGMPHVSPDYDEEWSPNYPGDSPTDSPGYGFIWRGAGSPSSGKGSWYNPDTKVTMHPDLHHPEPFGPHWDYKDANGKWWRIYPDNRIEAK